jgi:hypothetical protein
MKALVVLSMLAACTSEPTVELPYREDFSAPLGKVWSSAGGGWKVVDGRLFNDGAHNVPLWLDAALSPDIHVSFDVESKRGGDFKFEIFGDGKHHESGYVIIFAGWNNSRSVIGRLAEHGEKFDGVRTPGKTAQIKEEVAADPEAARERYRDRREIVQRSARLQPERVYRVLLERRGHDMWVFLDDDQHMHYYDPSPLSGRGHDRFAFNNWASEVYFDNLIIKPL